MTTARALNRRSFLRGATAAGMLCSPSVPAGAQSRRFNPLNPKEMAAGLWMITGATESFSATNGGAIVNIALLETDQGAIIIDTGSTAAMGAAIRAFADQRLGGVAAVINTHNHPDHWFGNAAFADCTILALPETTALCARNAAGYAQSLYAILGAWMTGTTPLPPKGAIPSGTLVIGGRSLRVLPLSGHTPADLALVDERTGTLIAGDLLFLDRAPSFPDADAARWLRALDVLEQLGVSGTLPGHGPYHRSNAALVQTRAFVRATDTRLQRAADLGLSPVEAMAAGPVPEFATLGANPEEYIRTVAQRWADYDTRALPLTGGL